MIYLINAAVFVASAAFIQERGVRGAYALFVFAALIAANLWGWANQ